MKPAFYHCEANVELISAAKYYKCQREGLGNRFLHAIHLTLARIQEDPERFPYYDRPARACRVAGFPYRLVYEDFPEAIHILAIMHMSRDRDYWKHRMS